MSEQTGDARYTMGRSKGEEERLIHQSQLYDAITRRFLNDAGVGNGMKVLDIGCGPGDVSLTAAELVGPDGSVVGVDVNPDIIGTARDRAHSAGFSNVEFRTGDARTLDVGSDFDVLTGRLVLMYMGDPAEALRQLTARLRPGGIVAFQEAEFSDYHKRADTPVANDLIEWAISVFKRSGAHIEMGLNLFGAFVDAGLPEPEMHLAAPVGGPENWTGYRFVVEAFRSLVPLMEEFGIATAEEVDLDTLAERLRNEVVATKRAFMLPPHVTAWAVLPD